MARHRQERVDGEIDDYVSCIRVAGSSFSSLIVDIQVHNASFGANIFLFYTILIPPVSHLLVIFVPPSRLPVLESRLSKTRDSNCEKWRDVNVYLV